MQSRISSIKASTVAATSFLGRPVSSAILLMISGDKKANYGTVIEVMALLRTAGFTQVGLKTDAEVMKEKR